MERSRPGQIDAVDLGPTREQRLDPGRVSLGCGDMESGGTLPILRIEIAAGVEIFPQRSGRSIRD
jgi:hypothetical protein